MGKDERPVGQNGEDDPDGEEDAGEEEDEDGQMVAPLQAGIDGGGGGVGWKDPTRHHDAPFDLLHSEP